MKSKPIKIRRSGKTKNHRLEREKRKRPLGKAAF